MNSLPEKERPTPVNATLIICPFSLAQQWEDEVTYIPFVCLLLLSDHVVSAASDCHSYPELEVGQV